MNINKKIHAEIKALGNSEYAVRMQSYFKTGKGEYAEGDRFLGIRMPVLRATIKKYKHISIDEAFEVLTSRYHEVRMFALLLLVELFKSANEKDKKKIFSGYLHNTQYINNWDLVDSSAGRIIGAYLSERDKKPIYKLSRSKNLWERRISIIATSCFIANNDFDDCLKISEILLHDEEDLIHKAVGWMLREVGNRDITVEERFLKKYYQQMPRTMLRYAIERFSEPKRKGYLHGTI
ncbi:MAG: DNA alkylation repair protein [Gammaproteobacteria bacterium]|nr:DNA alkylation repair protein [Gammaproteobacteria bacterium]